MNIIPLIALGAGLYLATKPGELSDAPRGIRNHNPGNLEANGIPWEGLAEEQTDGRFYQFVDPFYGLRAMARTLLTYRNKYGIRSVIDIISRYAPEHENDTSAYAKFVADRAGIGITDPVTDNTLPEVIKGMVALENEGLVPYPDQLINDAIEAAKA